MVEEKVEKWTSDQFSTHVAKWCEGIKDSYVFNVQAKDTDEAEKLLQRMSPLEHLITTLLCMEEIVEDDTRLMLFVGRFYNFCQALTEFELGLIKPTETVGFEIFGSKLAAQMHWDTSCSDKWKVMCVLVRLGEYPSLREFGMLKQITPEMFVNEHIL